MICPLEQFYLTKQEPLRSTLLALRDLLLVPEYGLSAEMKYRMPCFTYHGKALCYLWVDKDTNEPYILWVDGDALNEPELEQGSRKRMKILRTSAYQDLPRDLIYGILRKAVANRDNSAI